MNDVSAFSVADPIGAATMRGLEVRSIAKSYDKRQVLRDVSLEVHRGEVVGLLGPNGAGKTTTIGVLTTRVLPTSGTASVAGVDVAAATRELAAVPGVEAVEGAVAAGAPAAPNDEARDARRYVVTVRRGEDAHRVAFADPVADPALRALRDFVRAHGRPA